MVRMGTVASVEIVAVGTTVINTIKAGAGMAALVRITVGVTSMEVISGTTPQAEVAREGVVVGAEMTTGITLGTEALVVGTTEEGDIDIGLQISFYNIYTRKSGCKVNGLLMLKSKVSLTWNIRLQLAFYFDQQNFISNR